MATAAPAKKKPGPKAKPRPAAIPKSRPKAINSKAIKERKVANQEKNFARLRAKAATIGDPANNNDYKAIALRKDDRPLTEMMMMFVRHWAAGESILSAAARAGYRDGGTYAYRLAKDPAILKIYNREKKLYEESCQITRRQVMEGFLDAAAIAKLQADPTAMVGAWREVGKMCGYYEPVKTKVDITVNGTVTQRVERLSDDDLLKLIRGEVSGAAIEKLVNPDVEDVEFTEVAE